jgi:hypothetical protein
MESEFQQPLPKPNPVTQRAHRRDVFWQITLPAVAGSMLILGLAGFIAWAGATGTGEVGRWADVSLLWLILPLLCLTLIPLLFFAGLVYAVSRGLRALPPYAHIVQNTFFLLKLRVRGAADKVVEPALRLHSLSAAIEALRRSIFRSQK